MAIIMPTSPSHTKLCADTEQTGQHNSYETETLEHQQWNDFSSPSNVDELVQKETELQSLADAPFRTSSVSDIIFHHRNLKIPHMEADTAL